MRSAPLPPILTYADLHDLDGKVVLVESAADRRNPPTGLRDTLEVRRAEPGSQKPRVAIALEFPQMFTVRAHHRTIVLGDEEIARLLASERDGTFEIVLAGPLDPAPPPGGE